MSFLRFFKQRFFLASQILTILCSLIDEAQGYHSPASTENQPLVLSKRKITQQDRTFYKFVTRPDIDAPVFHIDVHNANAVAPGHWFVSPYGSLGQDRPGEQWDGPYIYDGNGELVWSGAPMFGYWNIFDFESRMIGEERMLTLLSVHEKQGFILNSSYEIFRKVPLVHGQETKPNMHEFNVFDDGKRALFLTHTNPQATKETSGAVGFDGQCFAKYQGFREVKVDSAGAGEVIFDWDARRHIGLDEVTYQQYDGSVKQQCNLGWDILHLNSVVKMPDGDYLLSSRHTDAIYKISHTDGSIVWRLGGVKSDFSQEGWNFSRQHHALVLEQNNTHTHLTLFDNGIGDGPFEHKTSDQARGLDILLDTTTMKASIVGEYPQPSGERTNARGSLQTLPTGNKFMCWAYNSYMSEHTLDGAVVMEARIPIKLRGYRAFKHPWVGSPSTPPIIHAEAIRTEDSVVTVIHVSWNGDTRTLIWEFKKIDDWGNIQKLGQAKRLSFETKFESKGFAENVFAEAFDEWGNSLGKSEVATTLRPVPLDEYVSSLQNGQQDSSGASGPLGFRRPGTVFVVGLLSGVLIFALAWIGIRIYKKNGSGIFGKDQDAKYTPLQQETD